MDNYGWISLIPPIVAIVLALTTKQTILSLFFGVWVGSTIINNWNPLVGFTKIISDFIIPSIADPWNAALLVLVAFSGGFVHILSISGAAEAFAQSATKKINTRKKAQVSTWVSAFIFSFTEPCLILGTIMRPVTDKLKVPRAKLAYILDSMGSNLASFSPISSYGPFVTGLIATQLAALGLKNNPWSVYLKMFPFNLYGLFAMLTVLIVILTKLDVGPMYLEEKRAMETGQLLGPDAKPLMPESKFELPEGYNLTMKNFLVPIITLFVTIFIVIFWTGDISKNGFRGSFINGNIVLAICSGFLLGSISAGAVGVFTGLFGFIEAFDEWTKGVVQLMVVPLILVMAWSIGEVTGIMNVGGFLTGVVDSFLNPGLVPALIFLIGALISFATGSSWGVWSIMMPIAIPMAHSLNIPLTFVIGAVVGGGLFGDHCSPISDTTILSSTGAACDHIVHVRTQIPYTLTVGISAFIGFLLGGLTKVYWLSIIVSAICIVVGLFILNNIAKKQSLDVAESSSK